MLVLSVFAIAIAARSLVLIWSPLPATLDGFRYARLAASVLETGSLFTADVQSDELVTTLVLATSSDVTSTAPLYLAQPLVAILGGSSVLSVLVLVRESGHALGWSPARTRTGAGVAALCLAVSGIYLRRSGVPDEEALGLLFLPLFTLSAYRFIDSRRRSWGLIFAALAIAYPPLHNLSSVVAAFTLTALVALLTADEPRRKTIVTSGGALAVFWGYFFAYYGVVEWLGLELTYSGLFRDNLGSLVAWLVALCIGCLWLQSTSVSVLRFVLGVGVGALFLVVGINALTPVFPGTIATPTLVLGLVALYLFPVLLSLPGFPRLVQGTRPPAFLPALFFGPLALTWFMFTTALTPEFFGAAQRVQAHLHIALFVVAVIGVFEISKRNELVGKALLVGLLTVAVLTSPLAFIHLDTATAPRTVHQSEFAAVSFASTGGTYASDHRLSRVGPLYFGGDVTSVRAPTRQWVRGAPAPDCLMIVSQSWSEGAHFYPLPPEELSANRLADWRLRSNLVYVGGGSVEVYVGLPSGSTECRPTTLS